MIRDDPVIALERWVDYGGHYRVRELSSARAVVDLCSCHGEPVDHLESRDQELIAYLRDADETAIARLEHEEAQ